MNDLISRSALLQEFETETNSHRGNDLWHYTGIKAMIENAPTAYDVEKVVERLENASWWTQSTFDEDGYSNDDSETVVDLDKAIEIVKAGGTDE